MILLDFIKNILIRLKRKAKFILLSNRNRRKYKNASFEQHLNKNYLNSYKKNCKKLKIKTNVKRVKCYLFYNKNEDINYITEEYYKYYIEPYLNLNRYAVTIFRNKALIDLLPSVFKKIPDVFLQNYLKKINGVFYNNNIERIKNPEIFFKSITDEKLVFKKIIDSGGSRGVKIFFKNNERYRCEEDKDLMDIIYSEDDFIIQKFHLQHEILASFNKSSANTARVITYRSVTDEKIHILHHYLRIGEKDQHYDNIKNGKRVRILDSGQFDNWFLFRDFSVKPNTNNSFFPNFDKAKEIARTIASYYPYHRLLSFDFTVDVNENVKVIEINTSLTPEATNFMSGSLFGSFTNEVMTYVNLQSSQKKISDFKF